MLAWQVLDSDRRMIRWSGIAGVLGSLVMIAVFVIVGVFVGEAATDPESALIRFPDIQAARTIENSLYLAVLALWAIHVVGLVRSLAPSGTPASVGGVLSVVGLTVCMVGALPHVATVPISALYHAPGVTAAEQATLLLIWQAATGIFEAILFAGMALLPVGLMAFGIAMVRTPAFGRRVGGATLVVGALSLAAAVMVLIDPDSPAAALGFFGLIAFHLAVGGKVIAVSRAYGPRGDRASSATPGGPSRVVLGER